jgi:hypothetical protein
MVAHSQFCASGDHTLEAAEAAIAAAAKDTDADERFVFLFSDANLRRYGIPPAALSKVLTSEPSVHAHAIFLSSLGGEAEALRAEMPSGRASVCLDAADVPAAVQRAFAAAVLDA